MESNKRSMASHANEGLPPKRPKKSISHPQTSNALMMSSLPHPLTGISVQPSVAYVINIYTVNMYSDVEEQRAQASHDNADVQEQCTQASYDANYTFIVSSLLQFLQLMYQGEPDTLFNTHPRTIRVAITSLLMYGLAHEAQLRFWWARLPPSYSSFVGHAVRFIGSVSVASLASVLVPDSAQPVLYLIYVLPSTAVFFQWFKRRVMDVVRELDSWSGFFRRMIRLHRVQGDWSDQVAGA